MPHNAWDAGNPDVGLAGELGMDSSRHSAADSLLALTTERVRALAEALTRSLTTMWGISLTRR